ncbi:MAG: carbohydrate ABC transporter permease [Candidatus Brocadiia bacterium]
MSKVAENPIARWLKHGWLWLMLAFTFLPFYVMLVVSLKNNTQFYNAPWVPTVPLHWGNWSIGWENVGVNIANSIFLAVTATLISLAVAVLAAYVFGRFRMPGGDIIWSLVLVLMLMPGVANLIPLFTLMKRLNMLNSLVGLSVVGAAGGQIICIYVLRNFIEDMPKEFFECARIDGATHLQQIIHVVVPQAGGIISTLAILRFVGEWNKFILPLITIRDPEMLPLAVGLYRLQGAYVKQWGPLMAAYFIAAIPLVILFAFTMRFFIRGISEGAIKG